MTTHTIRGLKCGTKYQVYMLAFNEVGNSDPSESLAFSTEGGGKCSLSNICSILAYTSLSLSLSTSIFHVISSQSILCK